MRQLVKDDFDAVFRMPDYHSTTSLTHDPEAQSNASDAGVDVLIHPSAIRTAPPFPSADHEGPSGGDLDAYVQDVLTVPASLAGLPALSLPMRSAADGEEDGDGWPIGVSVVGQWGSDEMVLRIGEIIEGINRCEEAGKV